MIIYQLCFQLQRAGKFMVTRRKDTVWPDPRVHFMNSLKVAKKTREVRCSLNQLCTSQCSGFKHIMAQGPQCAEEKPKAWK